MSKPGDSENTGFTLTGVDNEFNSDNIAATKNAMNNLSLGRGNSSPTFIKN